MCDGQVLIRVSLQLKFGKPYIYRYLAKRPPGQVICGGMANVAVVNIPSSNSQRDAMQ